MKYPIGSMTVGDILSRGLQLLFSRLGTLYTIMLIVELPLIALRLALPEFVLGGLGGLVILLPTVILQTIGTGAMIRVIMQEYLDRPVTLGEAFEFALGRLGGLLGTSILSGLFIFLGCLACLIPGIYLGVIYSVASQVVVVEDRAGMDALNRSQSLVSGFFWHVFGILFVVGLIAGALAGAIGLAATLALPYQDAVRTFGGVPTVHVSNYGNYALVTLITTLVQIFFQTYTGVCTTLLYFDLRNRKEAFDLELEAEKINTLVERFGARARPGRLEGESGGHGHPQAGRRRPAVGGRHAPARRRHSAGRSRRPAARPGAAPVTRRTPGRDSSCPLSYLCGPAVRGRSCPRGRAWVDSGSVPVPPRQSVLTPRSALP